MAGKMQTKRPTDGKVGDITVYTPDQRITHAYIWFDFSKRCLLLLKVNIVISGVFSVCFVANLTDLSSTSAAPASTFPVMDASNSTRGPCHQNRVGGFPGLTGYVSGSFVPVFHQLGCAASSPMFDAENEASARCMMRSFK